MSKTLKESLMNVIQDTTDGTTRLDFTDSNYSTPKDIEDRFNKLVEENQNYDVIQYIITALYIQLDRLGYSKISWNDLISIEELPAIFDLVESDIKENKRSENILKEDLLLHNHKLDIEEKVLSYEEAVKRALKLDIDADLASCPRVGLKNKRALVYNAYTGSGKSLGLDMWIAHTKSNQYGIILTHDNAEAQMHYKRIIEWNKYIREELHDNLVNDLTNKVFVYNTAKVNIRNYHKVRSDISQLKNYNWIICYQGRLLDGNVDVLSTLMNIIDENATLFGVGSKTYIFSDEKIPYAVRQDISANTILAIEEHSNHALLNYAKNRTEDTQYVIETYFNDLNNRLDSNTLTDQDKNVINLFTSKRIEVSSKMGKKVYLARYRTLINFIANRPNEFLDQYYQVVNGKKDSISYFPRIDEVALKHDLIIFDATARIDYGDDNPYFTIKTIAEQPKNLIDFHFMDQKFPERGSMTKEEFDKFFIDLKNSGFKFKDESLIIWNASPWNFHDNSELPKFNNDKSLKRTYTKLMLEKYLYDTLGESHHCVVTYFNGSDMLGKNRFSHCKNVYILGNYHANQTGLHESQAAMLNFHFNDKFKWLSDVIQGIGRGALRLGESMNVYLEPSIPKDLINTLLNYYDTEYNRIHWSSKEQYKNWIGVALNNAINGPLQDLNKSECRFMRGGHGRFLENDIKSVNYIASAFLNGNENLDIYDLYNLGFISKPELDRLILPLRTLRYLGIDCSIHRGKGKRMSEINSLRCF